MVPEIFNGAFESVLKYTDTPKNELTIEVIHYNLYALSYITQNKS